MTESTRSQDPTGHYRARIALHRVEVDRLGKLSTSISSARVACFLALGACAAAGLWGGSLPASIAAGVLTVVFVGLVVAHERIVRREDDAKEALTYVEAGPLSLRAHWRATS